MTESCSNTLKTGDVLNNKWVILEFIDKGGMGEVYRAHQVNLNRDVAIKVISREWLESIDDDDEEAETLIQRFRREVQAMAQIRHPNILQVFDHDSIIIRKRDEDTPVEYIAMEYIPGGSLRATMSEEGFYPEEILIKSWIREYFLPVLDGVQALHNKGIVHRDLKPENILIDDKTPKIADFGLARSNRLTPVTRSIEVKGSPAYMSPEHFFDFKSADQRADVYSLGKILFEAVEGKIGPGTIPFKSANLTKAESAFFQQLDRIISDTTDEDRKKRTDSVLGLHEQLVKLISIDEKDNRTGSTKKQKTLSTLAKPKWIWAGIIVATLSVLLMTAWHLVGQPDKSASLITRRSNNDHQKEASLTIRSDAKGSTSNSIPRSIILEHIGKQLLVPVGQFVLPSNLKEAPAKPIKVASFYMDEFRVTNQQFVDFLNHNIARVSLEDGVVKGDGANWFLLGEVHEGYEPIVYRNEEFHISDPAYASSSVLRVSGYGASAFAEFYGRRLPTEVEWFYATSKGASSQQGNKKIPPKASNEMQMEGMMQNMMQNWRDEKMEWPMNDWRNEPYGRNEKTVSIPPRTTSREPPPAIFYDPNAFGIRGLNEGSGEWGLRTITKSSNEESPKNRYAVFGGLESVSKKAGSLPPIISRFPWEGFEEVGFRTAKNATIEN